MLRTSETETEILLGNKQLLGIFFVVAILLGASFTGGYMLGRDSGAKKVPPVAALADPAGAGATPSSSSAAGETHSFPADAGPSVDSASAGSETAHAHSSKPVQPDDQPEEPALGAPKSKRVEKVRTTESLDAGSASTGSFSPEAGQQFLQVAAVGRDEAEAVADVLHKKGFRAHAVPKPGAAKLYRVIIGPIRDPGDLSNTRDALRRTGFREVIVQRY